MTYLKSNKELAKEKLLEFNDFMKNQENLFTVLSLDIDHFFEQYPSFDPYLYALVEVDTRARLDELNKGNRNEQN